LVADLFFNIIILSLYESSFNFFRPTTHECFTTLLHIRRRVIVNTEVSLITNIAECIRDLNK
jgi:hypothetical protein